MRPNEKRVMEMLAKKFGGEFSEGEDPPDAFLKVDGKTIAVEITELVQQVPNEKEEMISKLSLETPIIRLFNELNNEMEDDVPSDKSVFLMLEVPVENISKTKDKLKKEILKLLDANVSGSDLIDENGLSIDIYDDPQGMDQKISGSPIPRMYVDSKIHNNAKYLLNDRIVTKSKKCKPQSYHGEYWLVLFNNDDWIAGLNSYKHAYKDLNISHDFDKIYIVNDQGRVECLAH